MKKSSEEKLLLDTLVRIKISKGSLALKRYDRALRLYVKYSELEKHSLRMKKKYFKKIKYYQRRGLGGGMPL